MSHTLDFYDLAIEGLSLAIKNMLIDSRGNVFWKLMLHDLMVGGMTISSIASEIDIQVNSLIRLRNDHKAQPSFINGCRILAFYAKVQKSTKI